VSVTDMSSVYDKEMAIYLYRAIMIPCTFCGCLYSSIITIF